MHVDGFRFDLAASLARQVPRGGPALVVPRDRPPGPRHARRQAHRRAVGRRRRRLSGRQLPGPLVGVERTLSRHRPRPVARHARRARRLRRPLHRQRRPLRAAPGGARTRASTSSPRTTASRWPISSATSASTTRRTATRTATARAINHSWNNGVEGPTRRPGHRRAARAPATQPARDARSCRRACRCCSAATSSAGRSTATTTPTARTTSSRGTTGTAADLDAARLHAPARPLPARRTRCSTGGAGSRAADGRGRAARHRAGSTPMARR